MSIRFLLVLTILFSFLSFSQNQKLNDDEIYSIIKVVIKKEKLNKNYGLEKKPFQHFILSDEDFLKQYLKTPKKQNSDSDVLLIPFSNDEVLEENDISEMLDFKKDFRNFEWYNSQLKFSNNKKNSYQFSIPFINKDRTKVIIQYSLICPGLCGGRKTLFLNKVNNDWKITYLNTWIH